MTKRTITMGITAAAVIPIGLFLRSLPLGLAADVAGGVLYAVLCYLLIACVLPRWRRPLVATAALVWCFGVELLQLTDFPAQLAQSFAPARLVFGTSFAALDLAAYLVGVLGIWLVDWALVLHRHTALGVSSVAAE